MYEFKLADVGEGMHEAEIVRWLVAPGEKVKLDQPVLEIQTDKALVELPAPVAGTVAELRYQPGEIANVGAVLMSIQTTTLENAEVMVKAGTLETTPEAVSNSNGHLPELKHQGDISLKWGNASLAPGRVLAAPAVRKRATELGIDLALVPPGSEDGRVLMRDVEEFATKLAILASPDVELPSTSSNALETSEREESNSYQNQAITLSPLPTPPGDTYSPLMSSGEIRKPLAGLRRRIAERMEQAWHTIPHVISYSEVDATRLIALRQDFKPHAEKKGVNLTYLPFVIKCVVKSLQAFPIFNSSLDPKTREVVYKQNYHIGIATNTAEGLLVPVLRHAERLNLLQISAEVERLSAGGRARTLSPNELSGSTFTISNIGSYGGGYGTGIINPPEAAILVVGKISDKAVVRGGQVVARPIMPLSLSFDHRLIDGADAAQFEAYLTERLENPALLLLEGI